MRNLGTGWHDEERSGVRGIGPIRCVT